MLEITELGKYYVGGVPALKKVDLTLRPGEIVALLGENGAGKSTLMRCILGLTLPSMGQVLLDGEPITPGRRTRLAYATSEHSFFGYLTADKHRELYREIYPKFDEKRWDMLMEFFELPRHTALRKLSVGQKNQFELLAALSQGAEYILLDEPFAGSDLFNRADFYKLLVGMLREDECVLLSTHLVDEVKHLVDRAVLLQKGEIAAEVTAAELEEQNVDLVQWMKDTCGYRSGRAAWALEEGGDVE